jgi:transcriptional regulator with XRE-family HTH domain
MEWGASRILALRKHAEMTQAQFAKWLGVTIKQVKYLEHQRRNPSGPTQRLLDILAHHLGFDGVAAIQVLGASPTELKLPATITRPKTAVIKGSGNVNDSVPTVAEPDVKAVPQDAQDETPMANDEAFVWD